MILLPEAEEYTKSLNAKIFKEIKHKNWINKINKEKPLIFKKAKNRKKELEFLINDYFPEIQKISEKINQYTKVFFNEEIFTLFKKAINKHVSKEDFFAFFDKNISREFLNKDIEKAYQMITDINPFFVPKFTPSSYLLYPVNSFLAVDLSLQSNFLEQTYEELIDAWDPSINYPVPEILPIEHFTSLPSLIQNKIRMIPLFDIWHIINIYDYLNYENIKNKLITCLTYHENKSNFKEKYKKSIEYFKDIDSDDEKFDELVELTSLEIGNISMVETEILFRNDSEELLLAYYKAKETKTSPSKNEIANSLYFNFKKFMPKEKEKYFKEIIQLIVFEEPQYYNLFKSLDTVFDEDTAVNPAVINYKEENKETIKTLYSMFGKHLVKTEKCYINLKDIFSSIDIKDIEKASIKTILEV